MRRLTASSRWFLHCAGECKYFYYYLLHPLNELLKIQRDDAMITQLCDCCSLTPIEWQISFDRFNLRISHISACSINRWDKHQKLSIMKLHPPNLLLLLMAGASVCLSVWLTAVRWETLAAALTNKWINSQTFRGSHKKLKIIWWKSAD